MNRGCFEFGAVVEGSFQNGKPVVTNTCTITTVGFKPTIWHKIRVILAVIKA